MNGLQRNQIETAHEGAARSRAHWLLHDALAGGVRVRILLRMYAHPDKVYAAAREAAHSADEWQRIAAAYGFERQEVRP